MRRRRRDGVSDGGVAAVDVVGGAVAGDEAAGIDADDAGVHVARMQVKTASRSSCETAIVLNVMFQVWRIPDSLGSAHWRRTCALRGASPFGRVLTS